MYWRRQEGRRLSRRYLRCNGAPAPVQRGSSWPALGAQNGSTKTVSFVLSYVQCIRSAARQETG